MRRLIYAGENILAGLAFEESSPRPGIGAASSAPSIQTGLDTPSSVHNVAEEDTHATKLSKNGHEPGLCGGDFLALNHRNPSELSAA